MKNGPETQYERILSELPVRSPSLVILELEFNQDDIPTTSFTTSINDALVGLSCLRLLLLGGKVSLRPDALHHLSSLPHLAHIDVELVAEHYPEFTAIPESSHDHSCSFPSLQKISVHTDSIDLVNSLLDSVTSSNLESVHIFATRPLIHSKMLALSETLARHPSSSAISQLKLNARFPASEFSDSESEDGLLVEDDPDSNWTILPDAIRPLFALNRLRELTFEDMVCPEFDDLLLEEMAHAWPGLEALVFAPVPWPSSQYTTKVTLAGLAPLRTLVGLEYLRISLADIHDRAIAAAEALAIPPPDPSACFPSDPKLRMLTRRMLIHVNTGLICDAEHVPRVATLLTHWFPRLWQITVNDPWTLPEYLLPELQEVQWSSVDAFIAALRHVRLQEWRWRTEQTTNGRETTSAERV